jgi:hypothetical protein
LAFLDGVMMVQSDVVTRRSWPRPVPGGADRRYEETGSPDQHDYAEDEADLEAVGLIPRCEKVAQSNKDD